MRKIFFIQDMIKLIGNMCHYTLITVIKKLEALAQLLSKINY